jgi:ribonuclease-3
MPSRRAENVARELPEIAEALGLARVPGRLAEALTHPSRANEARKRGREPGEGMDNQRLEFLGDAVLGLCASELLMARLPGADEGTLSRARAMLVNADALAAWARATGLGDDLRMGRGAEAAGERDRTNVLADATEAVIAAVYLDAGLEGARDLCARIMSAPVSEVERGGHRRMDPKSELQERVQAEGRASPRYSLVRAEGPDHQRTFVVAVEVEGAVLGEGHGGSKKLAEQEAARAALTACYPAADGAKTEDGGAA